MAIRRGLLAGAWGGVGTGVEGNCNEDWRPMPVIEQGTGARIGEILRVRASSVGNHV